MIAKIATPSSESISRAAKRRGMFMRYCASRSRKARSGPRQPNPQQTAATTAAISQAPADAQAGHEIGSSRRQLEIQQCLPARGPIEFEEVDQIVINALQALYHIGEDREERDEKGADEQRHLCRRCIDKDQWRDRDNGRDLQDDRQRIKGDLDPPRLHKEDGKADPPTSASSSDMKVIWLLPRARARAFPSR